VAEFTLNKTQHDSRCNTNKWTNTAHWAGAGFLVVLIGQGRSGAEFLIFSGAEFL
jgi:hypothetical protein